MQQLVSDGQHGLNGVDNLGGRMRGRQRMLTAAHLLNSPVADKQGDCGGGFNVNPAGY